MVSAARVGHCYQINCKVYFTWVHTMETKNSRNQISNDWEKAQKRDTRAREWMWTWAMWNMIIFTSTRMLPRSSTERTTASFVAKHALRMHACKFMITHFQLWVLHTTSLQLCKNSIDKNLLLKHHSLFSY